MVINGVGEEWPKLGRCIGSCGNDTNSVYEHTFHGVNKLYEVTRSQANRVYGDEIPLDKFRIHRHSVNRLCEYTLDEIKWKSIEFGELK